MYRQWQRLGQSGEVVHSGGHRLRVLWPGRLNPARGPDFVAARFELDGVVYQGDVECHCRFEDWYHHQHHLDQAFAGVLLHLVAQGAHTLQPVTHRLAPGRIPTLALPVPDTNATQGCSHPALRPEAQKSIEQLAGQRLKARVRAFQSLLEAEDPERLFHRAFWRALGYPDNGNAFERLAGKWPWPVAFAHADGAGWDEETLYALYGGLAGFLPVSKNSDLWSAFLTARFFQHQSELPQVPLPKAAWQWAGQRSVNHPHFRLAAGVHLLWRLGDAPFRRLWEVFAVRDPFSQLNKRLFEIFRVPCRSYWREHFSLAGPRKSPAHRYYFGRARIVEILINVLIPLAMAHAARRGSFGFADYLEDFYFNLPPVAVYGFLRRQFTWLSDTTKSIAPVYLQGLLELYQSYCLSAGCAHCPVCGE